MKPWFALPTAFVLAAAGCGGSSSSPTAAASGQHSSASHPAPTPTRAADALTGTWQTAALPTATYVATYRKAGAPSKAIRQFSTDLASLGQDHRYVIRMGDGQWVLLEQHDSGTPQLSWKGAYRLTGDTVHAVENDTQCHLTYGITLQGDSLRIRLLTYGPKASPQCGRADTWPQRSIYETAAFHRVS